MPNVSAIIPTYNRAHLVGEAIESVLAQTRPVDEIIVVDDGSTDGTCAALSRYENQIRLIRQPNGGPSAARNRGLREARGDLIAFLDSDDLWVPRKTEWQLDFLTNNPDVEFVFGDMANFSDQAYNDTPEIKNPVFHEYLVSHAANLDRLLEWLIVENVIPTPTVMIRRQSAEKVGFFDETLTLAEDLDYWLRATRECRCGFLNAVLLRRRRHNANLVSHWINRNIALINVLKKTAITLGDQRPGLQELIKKKVHQIHYDLGSEFLKKADFDHACHYLAVGFPDKIFNTKWLVKSFAALLLRCLWRRRKSFVGGC